MDFFKESKVPSHPVKVELKLQQQKMLMLGSFNFRASCK